MNEGLERCKYPSADSYAKGCRCAECLRLKALRDKYATATTDEEEVIVNAAEAAKRLEELELMGFTYEDYIVYGLTAITISMIRHKTVDEISSETHDIIMGIDPNAKRNGTVDRLLTRMRVRRNTNIDLTEDEGGVNLVNLTPNDVCVGSHAPIPPSGDVAYVTSFVNVVGKSIGGVPLATLTYGDIVGLPDPKPGTVYIVSADVSRATDRSDVLCQLDPIRSASGTVIGSRFLGRYM